MTAALDDDAELAASATREDEDDAPRATPPKASEKGRRLAAAQAKAEPKLPVRAIAIGVAVVIALAAAFAAFMR